MTLLDFIEGIAQNALKNPQIFFQAGHNGPYRHPETLVRNKAHWLITFCKLYHWSGKDLYKAKALEFAEYLLSKAARPNGYSFYHRNAPKKDKCNGLIGQAWTFEALAQASATFQDTTYNKLAEEVFLQHHFNEEHALWNILEIDGEILPIDNAFNHQLWFASSISLINSDHPKVQSRISMFLDKLFENVIVLDNGLIYHEFGFEPKDSYGKKQKAGITMRLRQGIKKIFVMERKDDSVVLSPEEKKEKLWQKMKYKSIGYQAFNTHAFAMLKQQLPSHPIWKNQLVDKVVDYFFTEEYIQGIEDNTYGFPYNPPGFEIPFSLSVLKPTMDSHTLHELSQKWINKQLEQCFDASSGRMEKNTADPNTLTARLYEITRLDKKILNSVLIDNKFV